MATGLEKVSFIPISKKGNAKEYLNYRTIALISHASTHSTVLAWRIPGTGEPGRRPSTGLHRVGHDWSDLAAAAHASRAMLKNLQVRLQQCVNRELPDVQTGFRKGRRTRDQIANIHLDHRRSKRVPEKHLLLFYWLCQSLRLCGSQQTVENQV